MPAGLSMSIEEALKRKEGHRFVVKLGGEVMLNAPGLDALAADVALLTRSGIKLVLVHGGGSQADALAERLGHTVRKVGGRRITDDDALEVAKMVYGGTINVELLVALKRHGAPGVGLSGVDADLITVTRRPPTLMRDPQTGEETLVDFGHVGDVAAVDLHVLYTLLAAGCVPVVASLAADTEGRIYNVNADTIARTLAAAMRASALILITNVPGILRDPQDPATLLRAINPDEIAHLIEQGIISGGMLPKVQNCIEALSAGVAQVQILDGSGPRSLLLKSIVRGGVGTVVRET